MKVYKPYTQALLGTASQLYKVVVLKSFSMCGSGFRVQGSRCDQRGCEDNETAEKDLM
jgi:hypothetical protein